MYRPFLNKEVVYSHQSQVVVSLLLDQVDDVFPSSREHLSPMVCLNCDHTDVDLVKDNGLTDLILS